MEELIRNKLSGKNVILVGFGREGQSSFRQIRKVLPGFPLTIADIDESVRENPLLINDRNVELRLGAGYLEKLSSFDLIIKTPGIWLKDIGFSIPREKITSQTDLFLRQYSRQVIGITGTKGKSTTATLLHYILKLADKDSILIGNIGRPAFNYIEDINPSTFLVFELSSHQLEYITVAPHISVLLNIYQEHLDAYHTYHDYQLAKFNITRFQYSNDYFIYHSNDENILHLIRDYDLDRHYLPFSYENEKTDGCFVKEDYIYFSRKGEKEMILDLRKKIKLKGDHNIRNIMAVINVCKLIGIGNEIIQEGIAGFNGLEHRMEYAGYYQGIHFYNDSIATIPEACMEAVKALENVDTLILGGFDRGIDYSGLATYLSNSVVRNFILLGDAGKRIGEILEQIKSPEQKLFMISRFDHFLDIALDVTRPGSVCLLSPAAASYDEFMNFEMRGKRFKELVKGTELF